MGICGVKFLLFFFLSGVTCALEEKSDYRHCSTTGFHFPVTDAFYNIFFSSDSELNMTPLCLALKVSLYKFIHVFFTPHMGPKLLMRNLCTGTKVTHSSYSHWTRMSLIKRVGQKCSMPPRTGAPPPPLFQCSVNGWTPVCVIDVGYTSMHVRHLSYKV